MTSTIKIKNSSTAGAVPGSGDLVQGELAVNVTDKKIYTKNASGTIVNLGTTPSITDNGNAEAIVIDSSENVGLGVTPSTSTLKMLQGPVDFVISSANSGLYLANNAYYNSGWKYAGNNTASRYAQDSGVHKWDIASSGTKDNSISFTQAMTLDASGNLGIGVTSMNASLHVQGTATTDGAISFNQQLASTTAYNSSPLSGTMVALKYTSGGSLAGMGGWAVGKENSTDGNYSAYLGLYTRANGGAITERARIDSSGNLLVGTTTANGVITTQANLATQNGLSIKDTQNSSFGSGQTYVVFTNSSGSGAGSIQHTATTTVNYATSSDARLKTSLGVATDTSVIDNTIIHDFEWKEDGRIDRGVFAQEAYEVKPFAVSVGTDELTEDETLKHPWGVDYSKYVPDLIVYAQQLKKQMQEQQAIITQLQADVAALKG